MEFTHNERYYNAKILEALYRLGMTWQDVRLFVRNQNLMDELYKATQIILRTVKQTPGLETHVFEDIDIRELGLVTAVRNELLRNNVTSLGVLALQTPDQIKLMPRFGPTRVDQLRSLLEKHGLSFRDFHKESARQKSKRYAIPSEFVRQYFANGFES